MSFNGDDYSVISNTAYGKNEPRIALSSAQKSSKEFIRNDLQVYNDSLGEKLATKETREANYQSLENNTLQKRNSNNAALAVKPNQVIYGNKSDFKSNKPTSSRMTLRDLVTATSTIIQASVGQPVDQTIHGPSTTSVSTVADRPITTSMAPAPAVFKRPTTTASGSTLSLPVDKLAGVSQDNYESDASDISPEGSPSGKKYPRVMQIEVYLNKLHGKLGIDIHVRMFTTNLLSLMLTDVDININ